MRWTVLAAFGLIAACRGAEQTSEAPANDSAAAATNEAATPALGAAPATKEAALKLMHDRHENMEDIGDATKAVNRTLKTDAPDLAVIRDAAATYSRFAPDIPSWFPHGTGPDVGKTHAKPAIWEKPEDFVQKAGDFRTAVATFDAAAKSGDINAIKATFGDLGKACKACHDPYRAKDE